MIVGEQPRKLRPATIAESGASPGRQSSAMKYPWRRRGLM
jgi:hypothetical protein